MRHSFLSKLLRSALLSAILVLSSCAGSSPKNLTETDRLLGAYVLSTNDNSDSGTYSTGLAYYVDSSSSPATAAVAKGSCTATALVIPATYNGLAVTGVMPSGFVDDTALASVSFPTSISLIGTQAFKSTGLTNVTIPAAVTALTSSVFMDCRSLSKVTFAARSNSVRFTSIGDYAFAGDVALSSFAFPAGVQSVGDCAFAGCLALPRAIFQSITVNSTVYGLTAIGAGAFEDCAALGLVFFPSTMSGTSASVGEYAFKNCGVANLYLASTLPSGYAETGSSWNYVKTSSGTSSYVPITTNKSNIGYADSFYYGRYDTTSVKDDYDIIIYLYSGTSQTALNIPATLTDEVGTHKVVGVDTKACLNHTELISLTFAENLQFINSEAFEGASNLQQIDFSGATALKTIGNMAFYVADSSSSLTSFTTLFFPANITSIGANAFANYGYVTNLTFENTTAKPSKLTTIGDNAFVNLGKRTTAYDTTLILPGSLTLIGTSAFNNALCVRSIVFSDPTVDTTLVVKATAFFNLFYLTSLTFSSSEKSTFKTYSIAEMKIFALDGPNMTYNGKTLHYVYIPNRVTQLGSNIFLNRARLSVYCQIASKPSTWADGWNNCGKIDIGDTSNLQGGMNCPSFFNVSSSGCQFLHYSLTSGGATLFDFVQEDSSVNSVTLARYYFDGNQSASLTPTVPSSVTIGGTSYSVTKIGDSAFFWSTINAYSNSAGAYTTNTSSLTKLYVPASVTAMGDYCFSATGTLTEISLDSSATNQYVMPTNLTSLGVFCFAFTGLVQAVLPGSITSMGEAKIVGSSPFLGCFNLTSLSISNLASATNQVYFSSQNVIFKKTTASNYGECYTMASGATYGTDGLKIAWGCTKLDPRSFRGQRKVTKILFPYTLSSIGEYFIDSIGSAIDSSGKKGYNNLTSIRFYTDDSVAYPASQCKTIEKVAFWSCTNLTTCEFPSSLEEVQQEAFFNCKKLEYFPTTSASTDTGTSGVFTLPSKLATIGFAAFQRCQKIKTLTFSSDMRTLRNGNNDTLDESHSSSGAFAGCTGLTSLTLNAGLETIGDYSFYGCNNAGFTTLTLPSSVTTVGKQAFRNTKLTTATLSSGLTSLGDGAFQNATSLSTVTFNSGANTCTLTGSVFNGCTGLTKILLPAGAKFSFSVPNYPFLGCSNLAGIYLDVTGATYDSSTTTQFIDKFNFKSTETSGQVVPIYCHDTSRETKSSAETIGSWHWTNGGTTMTIGVGADS
jgi:hypothetical protein